MVTVHTALAQRVVLGAGAVATLVDEVDRSTSGGIFLIATRSAKAAADAAAVDLGDRVTARWDRPVVHTPVEITSQALARLGTSGAQCILAIGGGSAVGLSKALSARTGLPQIVVPTTYAGSEVTPVVGETTDGVKSTRRDPALLPGTVVYDPELTVSMPAGLTLTSAMNALAHAVEALWSPDATALSDGLATESARGILAGLPVALQKPADVVARGRLQESAWLAGLCLAQTTMGLHHQLAHALGGQFDLPHAELHTLLLPHVMAFNLPFAPAAADRLERLVGGGDPIDVVRTLAASYEGPHTLRELGVAREGLPEVVDRVVGSPYPSPRPLDRESVLALLEAAWR
jgi:alcohol dehydrogenase class IV